MKVRRKQARQIFRQTNIFYPQIRICTSFALLPTNLERQAETSFQQAKL